MMTHFKQMAGRPSPDMRGQNEKARAHARGWASPMLLLLIICAPSNMTSALRYNPAKGPNGRATVASVSQVQSGIMSCKNSTTSRGLAWETLQVRGPQMGTETSEEPSMLAIICLMILQIICLRNLVLDRLPHRHYAGFVASVAALVFSCLLVPTRDAVLGRVAPKSWNVPMQKIWVERNFLYVAVPKWQSKHQKRWWTCATYMFYHADDHHLFNNLCCLVLHPASYFVFLRYGMRGFFFIYLGGGVFACLHSGPVREDDLRDLFGIATCPKWKIRLLLLLQSARQILMMRFCGPHMRPLIGMRIVSIHLLQWLSKLMGTRLLGASSGVFALQGAFLCIVLDHAADYCMRGDARGAVEDQFGRDFKLSKLLLKSWVLCCTLYELFEDMRLQVKGLRQHLGEITYKTVQRSRVDFTGHVFGFIFGVLAAACSDLLLVVVRQCSLDCVEARRVQLKLLSLVCFFVCLHGNAH